MVSGIRAAASRRKPANSLCAFRRENALAENISGSPEAIPYSKSSPDTSGMPTRTTGVCAVFGPVAGRWGIGGKQSMNGSHSLNQTTRRIQGAPAAQPHLIRSAITSGLLSM